MRAPATRKIMAALQDKSAEPQALFVGGCVRNTLLGKPVDDIDIATIHTPDETTRRLQAAGLKAIPTGIDYGTVTGVADGKNFEITTLRKDVETDGRRAVVAYTTDWAEDAKRRDFTMNTLLMDEAGNVFDPTGQGVADLKAGKVIFVGSPAERIAEDYLRILRFFRFYGTYGKDEPDAAALSACKAAAAKIETLSRERITQEFFKILMLGHGGSILKIMFGNNILKNFSNHFNQEKFSSLCKTQEKYDLPSLAPRLFLLAGEDKKNLKNFDNFLLFSKSLSKEINLISDVVSSGIPATEQDVKVLVYKYGREATLQALLLWDHTEHLPLARDWQIPVLPVTGEDLIAKGMKPGPELGAELTRLENEWIARGFKD